MNKWIKEQLKKCKVAEIPEFSDETTLIVIKKSCGQSLNSVQSVEDIIVGHFYKIEVENYIINPYPGFALHDDWNQGIIPKDKFMNCEIKQIMNRMVKIEAVGADTNNQWSGWLPRKSFKVIEELK